MSNEVAPEKLEKLVNCLLADCVTLMAAIKTHEFDRARLFAADIGFVCAAANSIANQLADKE